MLPALNVGEEIARRLRSAAPPPAGFRPLEDDGSPGRFGLPARPDEGAQPALFGLWQRMLSGALEVGEAVLDVPSVATPLATPWVIRPRLFRPAPKAVPGPAAGAVSREAGWSENWSGAYVTPRSGERFTQVWGRWTVPSPMLPAGAATNPEALEHRCSVWVGLGGHRTHSRSMPQVGTTQAVRIVDGRPTAVCWAWTQWWVRDRNFGPVDLSCRDFPVHPGDEIICGVTVEDGAEVAFHLKNQSTGQMRNIRLAPPEPWAPADGASAEWIVERPTLFPSPSDAGLPSLHPLPDYGVLEFRECLAETRRASGEGGGTARDLTGARLIGMSESRTDPYRSTVISRPEKFGATSLRIHYRGGGLPPRTCDLSSA